MLAEGCSDEQAFEGLMHESDEVVFGDLPSPVKPLLPREFHAMVAHCGEAIDRRFGVTHKHKALVKKFDLRMAATEKRDLLPLHRYHEWPDTNGIEPFSFGIYPIGAGMAVFGFMTVYQTLTARMELRSRIDAERLASRPFVTDECLCAGCTKNSGVIVPCQVAA
jgi:hypothetical protein